MYNNSLDGFHSREDTYLCYKKITREYRLIWDFNFENTLRSFSERFTLTGVLEQNIRKQQKHIL